MSEDDNDEPAGPSRAALMIATDPSGRAKVIFHNVTELSREEFDRYSEAYKTLSDILVTNLFLYFEEALV